MAEHRATSELNLPALRAGALWLTALAALATVVLGLSGAAALAVLIAAAVTAVSAGAAVAWTVATSWHRPAAAIDDLHELLPDWVAALPAEQQQELTDIVTGLEHNKLMAQKLERAEQRRADRAKVGLWRILNSAAASEEQLRARIVADLHDGAVQMVTVATYMTEDPAYDRDELRSHLRQTEAELRELMAFNRPPQLKSGSLGKALGQLSAALARHRNLKVEWAWPEELASTRLTEAAALTLYRFFQEALTNVAKHAGVDTAQAGLELLPDQTLRGWVHDRGRGFDPATVNRESPTGHHIGLNMMSTRAEQLGAALGIQSAPGSGTTVEIAIQPAPENTEHDVTVGQAPRP